MPLPLIGETLDGKYRIERLIGRGGMGAVFQARHAMLDQLVAIKFLLPEVSSSAAAVARFINEARAAAQVRNDHVARVLDVVQMPSGGAFMVLEYLEGLDLATLVANQGPLTVTDSASYILQGLEAIAQAHALGIVHRDLKPANLFLAHRPDGTTCVKVLDFGISKATGMGVTGLTATNAMLGSPSFMSPEQVRSPKNVDARSDLWSAGVCLYHMLTCQLPYKGDTFGEVFAAILELVPPLPSTINPSVPRELDAVISKCLQRHPDDRYRDTHALAEALAPFAPEAERGAVDRIRRILSGSVRIPVASVPAPSTIGVTTPPPRVTNSGAGALPVYRRISSSDLPKQESYQTEKTCAPPPPDEAAAKPVRSLLVDDSPTDLTNVRKRVEAAAAAAAAASAAASPAPSSEVVPSPAPAPLAPAAEPAAASPSPEAPVPTPPAQQSQSQVAGAATEPAYPAFRREPLDIEESEDKPEADTEQVQSPFSSGLSLPTPPSAATNPTLRDSLSESDEETDVSLDGRPTERALTIEPEPQASPSKRWVIALVVALVALAAGAYFAYSRYAAWRDGQVELMPPPPPPLPSDEKPAAAPEAAKPAPVPAAEPAKPEAKQDPPAADPAKPSDPPADAPSEGRADPAPDSEEHKH